jgi:hypothetical protein
MPFGGVEVPEGIVAPPTRGQPSSVWAFEEIFGASLPLTLSPEITIRIPTVPGFAAAKLGAWLDRAECLATATQMFHCEVELSGEPTKDDRFYREEAAGTPGVRTVDLTPAFCDGAPRCLPMIDDIVVWRDNSHFSMQIIQHRRERAWQVIESTGVLGEV